MILLTDGVNNSGQIAPLTAADIAQTLGIRVYTIGVGSEGTAPYPALDMWGNISYVPMKVEIDEKMLTQIAEKTGGKYFRATDNNKLRDIYEEINQMEKKPRGGGKRHPLLRTVRPFSRWPRSRCWFAKC